MCVQKKERKEQAVGERTAGKMENKHPQAEDTVPDRKKNTAAHIGQLGDGVGLDVDVAVAQLAPALVHARRDIPALQNGIEKCV